MSKLLKTLMILGLVTFAFAPSAHATPPVGTGSMGICNADWIPNSSTYCSTQSGLDFGLTSDSNPTFNIAASPSATTSSTDLVILVPNTGSATLPFTATFTEYNGSTQIAQVTVTVTSPSGPGSAFSSGSLLHGYLGLTLSGTGDYQFSQILDHELNTSANSFNVYLLTTSLQLGSGDYVTVTFSSGASFPYGTIFLALGDNGSDITQVTPFTLSLQDTVPEPMTLSLFGSGLLGIALVVRRRMRKESEDEA